MKTKKLITKTTLMLILILSTISCVNLIDPYNGWDGTTTKEPENDGRIYTVKTPEEMAWIMEKVNSESDFSGNTVKIESDIRFNGREIAGIATGSSSKVFNGTIEGGGYTMSSFTINKNTNDYIGFVGQLGTSGKIQNLILEGRSINGNQYVGGIAGLNKGQIINCMSKTEVNGNRYVGGIAGQNDTSADIRTSANKGNVKALTDYAGGVVGENLKKIENTYNTGEVTARSIVGGIVGYNKSGATVNTSYSSSIKVSGNSEAGGIAGWDDGIIVNGNYFLKEAGLDVPVNGIGRAASDFGATPITRAQMENQSTFVIWDFINTWTITTAGPKLKWEK